MKKIILITLLTFFLNNCGFKVINYSDLVKYNITEIKLLGDKSINHKIKSKLMYRTSVPQERKINLVIETTKNKSIKEKNSRNEITKYNVSISSTVKVMNTMQENIFNLQITKIGDYTVGDRHANTLENEKNVLKDITNQIADDVFRQISLKLNDL